MAQALAIVKKKQDKKNSFYTINKILCILSFSILLKKLLEVVHKTINLLTLAQVLQKAITLYLMRIDVPTVNTGS